MWPRSRNEHLTLTSDDLDAHARVSVPVHRVELDESGDDWVVEVRVLHRVRVRVSFEHLQIAKHILQVDGRAQISITLWKKHESRA